MALGTFSSGLCQCRECFCLHVPSLPGAFLFCVLLSPQIPQHIFFAFSVESIPSFFFTLAGQYSLALTGHEMGAGEEQ